MKMKTDSESEKLLMDGSKTWEYLAIGSCCVLTFSVGTVSGWNSPGGVKLLAPDSPIAVTPSDLSTLMTMQMIGFAFGPPINAFLVDSIGRKNTILLMGIPLIVSWGFIMMATSVWELNVARFTGGLFLRLSACACPMYIGEITSPETRGASSAVTLITLQGGAMITFICVPYLSISAAAGVFLAIAVTSVVLFCFMPESPYYLVMKNKRRDAKETLRKLRGKTDVAEDLANIMASLPCKQKDHDDAGKTSWKRIFTVRGNRRAFVIAIALSVIRFCGGFGTIFNYGELIFQETSDAISAYAANVSVGISMWIPTFVITFLVDKVGRKPLIWFSGIIAGLCSFAIGGFFFARDYLHLDVSDFALLPFIASMLMVFVLSCGTLSLQFIMLSELFAADIKAVSTTLIGGIGSALSAINCKLYILVAISWGYGNSLPFFVSGVVSWICTVILLYYTPETKGKTLAEIQDELNKHL